MRIVTNAYIVQKNLAANKQDFPHLHVCFDAFKKKKDLKNYILHHTDLWYKASSEFADQHCYTQNISETELHALTEMEGKSPSQQKKGQVTQRGKKNQAIL